ncbi:MAG: Hpt domain-containing protein [Desulfovibrionaceae bacterium]
MASLVNWSYLVRLMGNEPRDAVAFCRMAAGRLPVDIEGIRQLARAGDWAGVARRVHALRSTARAFGAEALGERLLVAEDRAKAGEAAELERTLPGVLDELRGLAAELEELGARGGPTGGV